MFDDSKIFQNEVAKAQKRLSQFSPRVNSSRRGFRIDMNLQRYYAAPVSKLVARPLKLHLQNRLAA